MYCCTDVSNAHHTLDQPPASWRLLHLHQQGSVLQCNKGLADPDIAFTACSSCSYDLSGDIHVAVIEGFILNQIGLLDSKLHAMFHRKGQLQ